MKEAIIETFSLLGNICSIVGLGLSIWLMIRTGKIQKNIDKALEKNNNVINYINMRDDILSGLLKCADYLMHEHSAEERIPYLTELDGCLATLANCYPYMTANLKRDIDDVRSVCNGTYFSFIKIIKPLNNIISMLKMEAIKL